MRLIVNDFVGHPGQVQLSRELARRGHEVEHLLDDRDQCERSAQEVLDFVVRRTWERAAEQVAAGLRRAPRS